LPAIGRERTPVTFALPEVWTRAGISTSVCSKCR